MRRWWNEPFFSKTSALAVGGIGIWVLSLAVLGGVSRAWVAGSKALWLGVERMRKMKGEGRLRKVSGLLR